ncbi:MAG TPA: hypothetical protein IGS52_16730 [Oscillatoriaceae cyanobacterium M33_DOE_052]|nr:hypothetical protein [Oscillatoriaceae cyanobacterium M33_DOE_052]
MSELPMGWVEAKFTDFFDGGELRLRNRVSVRVSASSQRFCQKPGFSAEVRAIALSNS